MTRVTEIREKTQLPADQQAAFDEIVSVYNGRVVGPFRVLLYSPELARRLSNIGAFLRLQSPFPPNARELSIIATARELDCEYEWFAHEPGAKRTGVSDAAIDAVRRNLPTTGLPPEEAEIIAYVRALLGAKRIPDAVFQPVLARYGVRGVVELTSTSGFYCTFACAMNAFGVPGDAPIDLPITPRTPNAASRAPAFLPYEGAVPRIPLVASRISLLPQDRAAFDDIAASRGGRVAGPFQAMLHLPVVAQRTAFAGSYVRFNSVLPADLRELMFLATARATQCAFEWNGHESQARQAGVSEAAIATVRAGHTRGLTPAQTEAVELTRTLLETNRVPEDLFQANLQRLGVQGLVELCASVGYYTMVAAVLNAFEVQP